MVDLMINKEHLTIEGLQKIVNIKATINRGLSEELKVAFTNVIPPRFKGSEETFSCRSRNQGS